MSRHIVLMDGTQLRARRCASCRKVMAVDQDTYYCQNKECELFDQSQRLVMTADVVIGEVPTVKKNIPRMLVSCMTQVDRRATPCSHCGQTAYVLTNGARKTIVCSCGVAVHG
jgi:hypothetical protein